MGLEAGIWASRLEIGPWDWDLRGGIEKEKEEEEEKIPNMCENIGHRPLWGRCPKSVISSVIMSRSPIIFLL